MSDSVPEEIKQRRLREIINIFRSNMINKNLREESDQLRLVLVEGLSTKSASLLAANPNCFTDGSENIIYTGRTDGNKRVLFPATVLMANSYFSKFSNPSLILRDYDIDKSSEKEIWWEGNVIPFENALFQLMFGEIPALARDKLLVDGIGPLLKTESSMCEVIDAASIIGGSYLIIIIVFFYCIIIEQGSLFWFG
jgi:hypothetical protein